MSFSFSINDYLYANLSKENFCISERSAPISLVRVLSVARLAMRTKEAAIHLTQEAFHPPDPYTLHRVR